jgi:hypothetical protein
MIYLFVIRIHIFLFLIYSKNTANFVCYFIKNHITWKNKKYKDIMYIFG